MAKTFSLSYTFEPFENHETFFKKPMFGGLAVYLHGRMMMILMESPGDKSYKGQDYNYDIWNGILLPMERSSHESLQREFPELVSHPVLGKWLYLPMSAPAFELHMERIAQLIKLDDLRFGVYPKPRGKKKSKAKNKVKIKTEMKAKAKSLKTPEKKSMKKLTTKKPLAKKKTLKKRNALKKLAAEKAVRLAKIGKRKKPTGIKKSSAKK